MENAFFRYKFIIGAGRRVRSPAGQGREAVLGCEILKRMTEFGRPVSYRIGRWGSCRWASCGLVTISCNNALHGQREHVHLERAGVALRSGTARADTGDQGRVRPAPSRKGGERRADLTLAEVYRRRQAQDDAERVTHA